MGSLERIYGLFAVWGAGAIAEARGKGNKELMTQHAIEKLANAIGATTVTWRNGTVMQGNYVELKRKDAIALLQLLRPEPPLDTTPRVNFCANAGAKNTAGN